MMIFGFANLLVLLLFASVHSQYVQNFRRNPPRVPNQAISSTPALESNTEKFIDNKTLSGSGDNEIVFVLLISEQRELPIYYEVMKPSLELAIDNVRQKYPHLKFQLTALRDNNTCEENVLGALAAEEFYLRKVSVLIGPICSRAVDPVGRLASFWKVPLITAGGVGVEFSNKDLFKTLTRISFSLERVAEFFSKILQDYDWHHITFIVDETDPKSAVIRSSMLIKLKNMPDYEVFVDVQEFRYDQREDKIDYDKLLLQARKTSRIFFMLMGGELTRNFLIHAYDLGMNNGEYVFFGLELVKSTGSTNDFSWYKAGDVNNKKARSIYESFLSLAVRVPLSVEYNTFVNKVYKKATSEFDNIKSEDINALTAAFYDTALIYTWAYNRSLSQTGSVKFADVKKFLWNNIFSDGLSGDVVINENGDREVDYSLSDFNVETGTMQSVLTYFGRRRTVERVEGVTIHWPGNLGPPFDVPRCGFNDEAPECQKYEAFPIWAILLIVLGIVLVASTVGGFLVYQKVISERDLNSSWWNIDYSEITFYNNQEKRGKSSMSAITTEDRSTCNTSLRTTTQLSSAYSLASVEGKLDSVFLGSYRGIKIVYKPLEVKKFTLGRKILFELRMMRDVRHENLVKFIGLCMDDHQVGLVNELMIRGSLRDILDEDKMQIDWNFRYSMISDIIEGMLFLHTSNIKYHGRFKSSNCVIDGRFMVKITDYGMRSFHRHVAKAEVLNQRAYFWTAPEFLRLQDPFSTGSQKGDIYSFGIILSEIITRSQPFDLNTKKDKRSYEPNEVTDRIKMGLRPPFRPEIISNDCPSKLIRVMEACWDENPDSRPEFAKIKPAMKIISKGVSSTNFIDNLLKRMETYSENLEKIVEQKTQSVIEEKLKTEELVYQLLPRYVANELKKGNHVPPEQFDSVTVFFSDIVGFTTLSSQSNPMQVVNLLNDLYTAFDALINTFDAYKIETIGDAYMVASGVPTRNGNEHAKEICKMSLEMLVLVNKFKIRHLPDTKLRLRIGVHSGPCAAGVVGTKMPKYLLFGDTVNTASRMESSSEPLKIHISEATKKLLDLFKTFQVTKRGDIEVKGKGTMTTYWVDSYQEPKARMK